MTPDPRPDFVRVRSRLVFAYALIAAACATAIQVGWMERAKAFLARDFGISRGPVSLSRLFEAATRTVDPFAAAFAAIALFAFLETVRLVWRQSRPRSGGLGGGASALLPRTALGRVSLLLLATWALVRWHAAPGVMAGFDVDLHVSTVALAAQQVAEGRWPAWTDAWYLGFPLCQYYGGLYYVPAAALAVLFGGDVRVGSKVALALWHLAAAPSAYLLAREVGASRGASLVSGVAYAASPYFGATLAWVGSMTAAPVIALAPAVLRFAIRTARGNDVPAAALGWGLSLGFTAWAHPAYAVQVAALSALVACVAGGKLLASRRFALLAGMAVGAAVLAALPVVVAHLRGYPRPDAMPGAASFLAPHVPDFSLLGRSLRWSVAWPGAVGGYLGVTVVAFSVVGLVLLSRRGPLRAWLVPVAVVLLWTGGGFYQSRALLLLPVVLLPALAVAIDWVAARRPRVAVVAVALLAVDLAAGNLFSPYRADLEDYQRALSDEAARQADDRTVLLAADGLKPLAAGEWQVGGEAPLRTLTGGFREAAGPEYPALLAVLDRVRLDPSVQDPDLLRTLAGYRVTSIRVIERRRLTPENTQVRERLIEAGQAAPRVPLRPPTSVNAFLWAPALALLGAGWLVFRRVGAQRKAAA